MPSVRAKVHRQLDPLAWPKTGLSPLNRFLAVTIFICVVVSVIETEPTIRIPHNMIFDIADTIFLSVFVFEYVLRVWSAGENLKYEGVSGKLRFIITPIALLDLLAIIPFFLTIGIENTFLLRLFRLLRIFSLARLGRYSSALNNIYEALKERRYELLMSLFSALIIMLLAATAMHITEGANNPKSFGSIPRALWWGVATVTEVGYGGAFPVTVMGKIFAGVFAIASVAVVALPTGILAAGFSAAFQRGQLKSGIERDG